MQRYLAVLALLSVVLLAGCNVGIDWGAWDQRAERYRRWASTFPVLQSNYPRGLPPTRTCPMSSGTPPTLSPAMGARVQRLLLGNSW